MMEKMGYVLLGTAALWLLLGPQEDASFIFMIISGSVGIALLIIKVVAERVTNTEDKHYSKTVEK